MMERAKILIECIKIRVEFEEIYYPVGDCPGDLKNYEQHDHFFFISVLFG